MHIIRFSTFARQGEALPNSVANACHIKTKESQVPLSAESFLGLPAYICSLLPFSRGEPEGSLMLGSTPKSIKTLNDLRAASAASHTGLNILDATCVCI